MGKTQTAVMAVLMMLTEIAEVFAPAIHYLSLLIAASAALLSTISLVSQPNGIPKVPEGVGERKRDRSETGYLLSQSYNALPIGILVLNSRKQVLSSNAMARKWFDDPHLHSLTCKDLICVERNCRDCIVEQALNDQLTDPIMRQYRTLHGPLFLQISAIHVKPSEDHGERVVLIAQDVTAERMLFRKSSSGTIALSETLARVSGLRDHQMRVHATSVARWSVRIARRLGVSYDQIDRIEAAALVHDIGKFAIPEKILGKPGALAPEERAIIETHPEIGAEAVAEIAPLSDLAPLIKHHHERWDGSGYPSRLQGPSIPLGSRIIAVADVFDAMISRRPYREALPERGAIAYLVEARGKAFDAAVVDALLGELEAKENNPSGDGREERQRD
ncbi:MAG: HD-GYP domain-containing protein [Bacillota bacterium]